jgi:DNA-binding transcriptional ArsR family regulator
MSDQHRNDRFDDVSGAFDLLKDARRRCVLYALESHGRTTVRELSRRIAAWRSSDDPLPADPTTVEISLVHTHLPKLADAGVIQFDRERGSVELAESADDLNPLLGCTREREPGLFRAARTVRPERPTGTRR